jgi:hypothetical protein
VIHDLLDLIMEKLLKTDPGERLKAEELTGEMEELMKKAESDDKYLLQPVPRSLPTPTTVNGSPTGSGGSSPTSRAVRKPSKVHWKDQQALTTSKSWPPQI